VFKTELTLASLVSGVSLINCFWAANWEEYHTGVLRCSNGVFGLTEGIYIIAFGFCAESYTRGAFCKITIKDIGKMLLPTVHEPELKSSLGKFFNGSKRI
jgi:hypothetical protein